MTAGTSIQQDDTKKAELRDNVYREYLNEKERQTDLFRLYSDMITTATSIPILLIFTAAIGRLFENGPSGINLFDIHKELLDMGGSFARNMLFAEGTTWLFFVRLFCKFYKKNRPVSMIRKIRGTDVLVAVVTGCGSVLAGICVADLLGMLSMDFKSAAPFALPVIYLIYLAIRLIFLIVRSIAGAVRARMIKRARKRAIKKMNRLLSRGCTVICSRTSADRSGVAAVMPDGTVKKLRLGRYARYLLTEDCTVTPGGNAEAVLAPAPEAALKARRYRNIKRWAKDVIRDTKKKCRSMSDIASVADIRDRTLTGVTKNGKVRQIFFDESIYMLFDRPEDVTGEMDAGKYLAEKLLPIEALIEIKRRQLESGSDTKM